MKLLNLLLKLPAATEGKTDVSAHIIYKGYGMLLRLLAPITPHITHHLWQFLHYDGIILNAKWPKTNTAALKMDHIELVVQINGKLRSHIKVPSNAETTLIESIAIQDPKVQLAIENKAIKKIIVVPGRLVNVVAGDK